MEIKSTYCTKFYSFTHTLKIFMYLVKDNTNMLLLTRMLEIQTLSFKPKNQLNPLNCTETHANTTKRQPMEDPTVCAEE